MSVSLMPISLMAKVYMKVLPAVHQELSYWKERANRIPTEELKKQALASMEKKTFHCEGGSILAIMAQEHMKPAIRFIVAYQTISDYLDNLCDRSVSLDPEDFALLHQAMHDALNIEAGPRNYYYFREGQDDANYLNDLSETCRTILRGMDNYHLIKEHLLELCSYYCDLQIHKHVTEKDRVPRLKAWYNMHKDHLPDMDWYEFSACSGSTLGIFCLVSYSLRKDFKEVDAMNIRSGYFPYIQGLHILLDYFIDQEEDLIEGDLNFCTYYENQDKLFERLKHFVYEADKHTARLPHRSFHKLINRGLLGIYLSDDKVRRQKNVRRLAKEVMKTGGLVSYFFYFNGRAYRSLQRLVPIGLTRMLFK